MEGAGSVLPRWRGVNLLEMFTTRSGGDFREDVFRRMSDWGLDSARIPMCYTLWVNRLHSKGLLGRPSSGDP